MLSILIPTYNYSLVTLLRALKAQIRQLETPVEVLVCDDCSTLEDVYTANKQLAQEHGFTIWQNPTNQGRTATRDELAKKAKYDWLLFLDADVLPKNSNFLKSYLVHISANTDVIFGGISYQDKKPPKKQMLRWTYGTSREVKSVEEREKHPYFIISQNLCITKNMFFKCNTHKANGYGLDNLFSNKLKKEQAGIVHIDNPVFHLGLETSEEFLKKSLAGIATTVKLEEKGELDANLRPIQRVYNKLKAYRLDGLFSAITTLFSGLIKKNLTSNRPSLLLFDVYRLNHLIKLKKHD